MERLISPLRRSRARLESWLDTDGRRPMALGLAALIGLCILAFFQQLGTLGLMDKTEGLFVEVARQMADSGDWVTPRWNGATFFDYPVWGYWMVALSFRLFGLSEWAARLPVALAASAVVLALAALVWQLAPAAELPRRRVGRATLAATVLALSPGWVGWGRSSVTDMFLSSAIALALFGFALAYAQPERVALRRLGHGSMALFAGIATLAKGPVGLLLPGLVIIVFLLFKGQLLAQLRRAPLLPMAALFLGVTTPWYALATQVNGMEFLQHFIGFSNLERFTSVLYSHPGPPWYYLPWLLLLLLPWSLYLPVALTRLRFWRLERWRTPPTGADLPLLALVWLVVVVAFFSAAATKLPGYILPSIPAGALLLALQFQPLEQTAQPQGRGQAASGWVNAGVLGLMALAAALAPRLVASDPAYPDFAAALQASGLPQLLAGLLTAATLGLALLLLRPGGLAWLWLPNAGAFLGLLALVLPGLAPLLDRERQLPIRQLARLAGEIARPGEPLLVVGYKRYSVVYYSGRPVLFVHSADDARRELADRGAPGQPGPARPGAAPASLLLFGNDAELLEFGVGPGDGELLARRQAHRLIRLSLARLNQLQDS